MHEVGDRVGAICGSTETGIDFFGYGVYEGNHPLPVGTKTPFGEIEDDEMSFPNPRIRLNNGDVVYGCQCWWGSEADIKKKLEGYKVRIVPVPSKDPQP